MWNQLSSDGRVIKQQYNLQVLLFALIVGP